MWNRKNIQVNSFTKQKQTYRPGGKQERRATPGVCGEQIQTAVRKRRRRQGPAVQPGNLFSVPCDKQQWKRIQKVYACVCIGRNHCASQQKLTHYKSTKVRESSFLKRNINLSQN